MSSNNIPTRSIGSIFLDQDLCTNFNAASTSGTGSNNRFEYDFGGRTVWTTEDTKMSVANFSVPYSWYNICARLKNNIMGYVYYDAFSYDRVYPETFNAPTLTTGIDPAFVYYGAPGSGSTNALQPLGQSGQSVIFTIPDGYYDIPALNAYLQFIMIQNGHYLVDANGNNVYFLEIVYNPTEYLCQVNSFCLPGSLVGTTLTMAVPNPSSSGSGTGGNAFKYPLTLWTNASPPLAPSGGPAQVNYFNFPAWQLLLFDTNVDTGALLAYSGYELYFQASPWNSGNSSLNLPAPRVIPNLGANAQPASGAGKYVYTTPLAQLIQFNTLGDDAPLVNPVHSVLLTCSAVDNPLRSIARGSQNINAVNTNVLTTQNVNVPFGYDLSNSNFFTTWIPLNQRMSITKMQFALKDQDGSDLYMNDANTNIELLISNLKIS